MVLIKEDMNAAEDFAEVNAKEDSAEKTAEKLRLMALREELAPQIAMFTELVTVTSADALTVESRVANTENAIRLATANAELAELDI